MQTLYVVQQGCYVCRDQQKLLIKRGGNVLGEVRIPLLEQVLIFGRSQITTQAIQTCLQNKIPIAFLSRMGYCYGRVMKVDQDFYYQDEGCFLNEEGRKKFLKFWLQRMEEKVGNQKQPRWDILTAQIRKYKQFVYHPVESYEPYLMQ
ncbi:MAG: hypothetical protein BRC33_08325 [Cyanobacteria bacterium SW_9_44_58]|nr:MAG: hypothetical protein BRC33_08325 [Cyanobacteria bacterium SW_9_44_58]